MLEDAEFREVVRVMHTVERGIEISRFGEWHILVAAVVQQVNGGANLPDDAARRELIEQGMDGRGERGNVGISLSRLIAIEQVIDGDGIRRKLGKFVRSERRAAGRLSDAMPRWMATKAR
jgi:hypothetical protein